MRRAQAVGARTGELVLIYGSARVWLPGNLSIGDYSPIGPRVKCYNRGRIDIGMRAVVSQERICVAAPTM
jgi:putative colanic acid biosynthesis acetyltransferase WcaF